MTYIHPNNRMTALNLVLAGLVFGLLVGIFSLIALYNNSVDLTHSIAAAKSELDAIGVKGTALHQEVMQSLAAAPNGLVEETHPHYFSLNQNQSWPIASQR